MRIVLTCLLALFTFAGGAQELYIYSEPASNMPAHTIGVKGTTMFDKDNIRIMPEVMFGFNKNFMLHVAAPFSNMYTGKTRWEAAYVYGKYRFLSKDEVHRHFRMAAFGELGYTRNPYLYDEISLQGERSGAQFGLIATQLVNKFAASATVSYTGTFKASEADPLINTPGITRNALNFTLSSGLLVLPREYTSYNQTNFNIYLELLGQRSFERDRYYLDLAPAAQFIFNSNTKLNLGYRFQLTGNMFRPMERSFLVGIEHTFFNALK